MHNGPNMIQDHWVSEIRPSSGILNVRKRNVSGLDLFPSSDEGRETPTLLGPLERANFNHWTIQNVQKSSNSDCYTPSSELFRLKTEGLIIFRILTLYTFLVFHLTSTGVSSTHRTLLIIRHNISGHRIPYWIIFSVHQIICTGKELLTVPCCHDLAFRQHVPCRKHFQTICTRKCRSLFILPLRSHTQPECWFISSQMPPRCGLLYSYHLGTFRV
jgi:hypothetical protein